MPDLTLLLDLDPVIGMARIGSRRLDAFERMGLAFHERVREGYLEIARAEKHRVAVLDAGQDATVVHAAVIAAVGDLLAQRGSGHGG